MAAESPADPALWSLIHDFLHYKSEEEGLEHDAHTLLELFRRYWGTFGDQVALRTYVDDRTLLKLEGDRAASADAVTALDAEIAALKMGRPNG